MSCFMLTGLYGLGSFLGLQGWYMFVVAMALAARTFADVWMIENGTAIERFVLPTRAGFRSLQ